MKLSLFKIGWKAEGYVRPDIITYNSLIYSYCRERRMREALRLFKEIKGANPDQVTYTTLIDGCCRANDLAEALRLHDAMEAKGLYPGILTYNSILRKLCEEGRLKDANKLLNEMSGKKIEPDHITIYLLDLGNDKAVIELSDELSERGLCVDISIYRALIRSLCKREKIDCAERIFITMNSKGISGDSLVYTSLAYAYLKLGNMSAASVLLDEMYKKMLMVTVKLYKSFSVSFASDSSLLDIFSRNLLEKGPMSKTTYTHIQELEE
ncbi:hypothetical protein M9H77_04968 [Catharanthus roseus]|uniref:Uncharacterized protein n=1 Tax=Catharanthus roseus TaxID=4058 RepID=A0ACC0CFQ9_CATRO|nr:hypothetical protein M9H77_04968 [Catharanthus roseus]